MMSSSYPTSYPQIDHHHHRTIYKSPTQLERNYCGATTPVSGSTSSSKETLIADIFSPITNFSRNSWKNSTESKSKVLATKSSTPYSRSSSANSSYSITPRRPSTSLASITATKTKIPYPLVTLRGSNRNTLHFTGTTACSSCRNSVTSGGGGGVSLRLRVSKSNLAPLIMEPVANETALAAAERRVECTHNDTHENTTTRIAVQTGTGRFYAARRKLVLITQKPSTDSQLERSLSLRKNFKYSPKTDTTDGKQGPQAEEPLCAGTDTVSANKSAGAVHDADALQTVTKDSYKDQSGNTSASSIQTKSIGKSMESNVATEPMANGKLSSECHKMVSFLLLLLFKIIHLSEGVFVCQLLTLWSYINKLR